MSYHVYVSNSGSSFFSKFLMDAETGRLTSEPDIALGGSPGACARNAANTRMYVCLRQEKVFEAFQIDPSSGALASIGKAMMDEGSPYLETDNTDSYLMASYYGSGRVSVHAIESNGALSEKPVQILTTEEHAHSIQTDRSNRFAFVPHTNPPNAVYQFRFDEKTGKLTPNDPPKIQPDTPEGPRHFVFHPTRDLFYTVNENGSTVSAYHFDAEKGTLSGFQVISTLPEGYDLEKNTTAEIRMTHDGCHLYASNRGHDSIAIFDVQDDGTLAAAGHQPTEATPRYFEIDPSGKYLLSVGQKSGGLTSYRIDAASGQLEEMETFSVGESPLWIQFVEQS